MIDTMALPIAPLSVEQDVETAIRRARSGIAPVLLTRVIPLASAPDPLAFLQHGSTELGNGVYWRQPRGAATLAGAGAALEIAADGRRRFGHVAQAIRSLREGLTGFDQGLPFPIVGGFAFDSLQPISSAWGEFSGARFIVPHVLLQRHGDETHLRFTIAVGPEDSNEHVLGTLHGLETRSRLWIGSSLPVRRVRRVICRESIPNRASWEASVRAATDRIRQGALEKVVLSREERFCADVPFVATEALDRLRGLDPTATHFAMQSGQSWFLGATPERLVRLRNGHVDVTCLAGSIAQGESLDEQRALAEVLLASAKDREEHEIVVRSTMAALRDVCDKVTRETGTPRVVAARSVQHLETPIHARMPASGAVLDLVERLHPTPAVGGHPQARALDAIRDLERIDRGWYAGPFGWTDLDGSGEFVVAIRSAMLSGRTASLFAGGGIVAGSVPAAEFAETELKLRPMLNALDIQ